VKAFIKEFCGGVSRREIPYALRRNLFCIIQVIDQGWPQRGPRNVPLKKYNAGSVHVLKADFERSFKRQLQEEDS
jgi:hypothetical protein